MRMPATRRTLWVATALLFGLSLAACSGSKKGSSGTFASVVPTVDSTSTLSKAEFISKMNSVCAAIDQQRRALPTPAGLTDYPNIISNLTGTLRILPTLIKQADVLIQRSPDRATLTSQWLAIEKADFAVVQPIAQKMVADSTTKDATKVAADGEALSNAPNHSADIAAFMTSYGLTSCATLENQ